MRGIWHHVHQLRAFLGPEHARIDSVDTTCIDRRDHRRKIHPDEIDLKAEPLAEFLGKLDVEALQLTVLVDELLRRVGRIDGQLQFPGRNQVVIADSRGARGVRHGRREDERGDGACVEQFREHVVSP